MKIKAHKQTTLQTQRDKMVSDTRKSYNCGSEQDIIAIVMNIPMFQNKWTDCQGWDSLILCDLVGHHLTNEQISGTLYIPDENRCRFCNEIESIKASKTKTAARLSTS